VFPLAMSAAIGVSLALVEHVRVGDPFWRVDLEEIVILAGSAVGALLGALGLWSSVFRRAETLASDRSQWWATASALAAGMATASCWLASGYWPWSNLLLTYPVVAASAVAVYRLALLVIAKMRAGAAERG
jgi:hypothetical protein